jgi:hypothetical protein
LGKDIRNFFHQPGGRTEIYAILGAYIYTSSNHINVAQSILYGGYIYISTIITSGKIYTSGDYYNTAASTAYTNFSTVSNNKISGDNLPEAGATILAAIYYREGQRKSRNDLGISYNICPDVIFTSGINDRGPRRPQQG